MITTERWLICGPRDYGVVKDVRNPADVERARIEAEGLRVDLDEERTLGVPGLAEGHRHR